MWPLYLRELGAAPQEIGLVFGVGNLGAVLLFIPAGYLADRIGRRQMLSAAWLCSSIGVGSFVLLSDWRGAFPGSALYWASTVALPLLIAYVTAVVGRPQLGRALGIVLGAYFAGNIIGAPISGVFASAFGYRAAVALAAVVFFLSTTLTFALRSIPPHSERGPFRPPRAFWILLAITPLGAALSIVSIAFIPVYLHDVAAIPLERIGLFVALVSVGATALAVAAGNLADEVGPLPALLASATTLTAACLLVAFSGRDELLVGSGTLLLGATQAGNPVVAAAVERIIPPARAALGYATYQTAFAVGFGGGGTIAGFLYDADPLLPFIATAALALPVATIVGFVITRASPR